MLTLLLTLALAAQATDEPGPAADLPISLDRIRQGLQRTPALRMDAPIPEPTFRVEIVQHPYFLEVPFVWKWVEGGRLAAAPAAVPGGTPPLLQIDVLPWIRSAAHAYQQHAATVEVQRAIAEFCATHACHPE